MSDWIAFPLSRLAEVRVSNVDKIARLGETPVQLCNYMDVYTNDYIDSSIEFMQSTANLIEKEKFKVCSGDVIITKDSETPFDIGIPAVVIDDIRDLVCGYHLALIKPYRDKVEPVYLAKQLASNKAARYFSRMAAGSTRYGLSNGAIAATAIPIAPLEQQRKIAAILRAIDKTIEKTEALIHKYQQIKAGLMHDLFTRGLTADGKLRPTREQAPELYQKTPIGWIPKEWDVKPLEDLTIKIVDGTHFTPQYVDFGVPFVTVKNLTASSEIEFTNINYITEKDHQACYMRADPKEGDVLVTKDGTLGVCRIVKPGMPEFSIFVSVAMLRVNENLTAEWLHSFFDSGRYLSQLGYLSAGSGLKHIHLEHFKKFIIPFAEMHEQKIINSKVALLNQKISKEELFQAKLVKLKSGLLRDLLSGRVRVKVDDSNNQEAAA